MNQNDTTTNDSAFDLVIREVGKYDAGSQEPGRNRIYIVDRKTGEMRDEPPIFNFNGRYRYFEIGHGSVARDINGPEVPVRYLNSPKPLLLKIFFDVKAHDRGVFNLIRCVYNANSPLEGINLLLKQKIEIWLFDRKNFVAELKQNIPELEEFIKVTGLKCGLELRATVEPNIIDISDRSSAEQFISFNHQIITKTKDAQKVEIDHTLALTLTDPIKLKLSGIKDVRNWLRGKLEQYTNNAIIEKNYAEVIINMQDSIIKDPMKQECGSIGYELKQLITVPGIDIEKFYFETGDESNSGFTDYITRDTRLKIPLNIIVEGRLDLHHEKTRQCIVPGFDIISVLKKSVVEYARGYINGVSPDECFTSQFVFEGNLSRVIKTKLEANYGFKELQLLIKFLENDLSLRLSLLVEKPCKAEIRGDWSERRFALWFRVLGVSREGWYRFRANNYKSAEEELSHIARMVKNGLENEIMRTGDEITGKLISNSFSQVRKRVEIEFGLVIKIHDFNEEFSDDEELYIKLKEDENEERHLRSKILQESERKQLSQYLMMKEKAIEAEENEEEIKKIDERIASFKIHDNSDKNRFLRQKTDTSFLEPKTDEESKE
jgi:hypothetical protein